MVGYPPICCLVDVLLAEVLLVGLPDLLGLLGLRLLLLLGILQVVPLGLLVRGVLEVGTPLLGETQNFYPQRGVWVDRADLVWWPLLWPCRL